MKERMKISQIVSLSLMLFALFFGAGNMIFPPGLGQSAGSNVWAALAGFVFTDVGISLLAIAAIVLAGKSLADLSNKVGPRFAAVFAVVVYFLIGPLFAIPRTGGVSFELAILPFLSEGGASQLPMLLFTFAFFAITYLLSLNPNKIVDIVGKILTPVLLMAIAVIGAGVLLNPLGPMTEPVGDYSTIPFFKGLIEGYLALDGIAALVFALIVIENVQAAGVKSKAGIIKYSLLAGIFASIGLALVYGVLAYIGATSGSLGQFANGGQLLAVVTSHLYGGIGNVVLGIAVIFACLTTAIGLTTSFGDYFHQTYPRWSYRHIILAVCGFSFLIANVGLTTLINITLPVLIMVYPVTVVLVVTSFFDQFFHGEPAVYIGAMVCAFAVSVVDGLETGGLSAGILSEWVRLVPFYDLGIGWLVPAILGAIAGFVFGKIHRRPGLKNKK